jgi:hypothetical protein
MLPVTSAERALCTIYMLLSGCIWTYVLGTAAGIAATLDPNGVLFKTTMDQLNLFMRERNLPTELKRTLRDFFTMGRDVHQVSDDGDLLAMMSPLLQGMVALEANKRWIQAIWYFDSFGESREGREVISFIAKSLQLQAFVTHERLAVGQMFVLRRGMCVKNWRFLREGRVWGDDMILVDPALMDHAQAVALTFVEAFTLTYEDLEEVLNGKCRRTPPHPDRARAELCCCCLRFSSKREVVRRFVTGYARATRATRGEPSHTVTYRHIPSHTVAQRHTPPHTVTYRHARRRRRLPGRLA